MKLKLLFLAFSIGVNLQSFAQKPADPQASLQTVKLYEKISSFRLRGIMIGHQDDLAYGHSWNSKGTSDVKQTTGDFPAVFGWELGGLELGNSFSLDSVAFTDIKNGIQWVNSHGGINTVSWHSNNPLTGKNAWDVSSSEVVKSVLPGGEKNELFIKMLERLSTFFNSLKDEKGNLIPIVFRPFHEHTGSWFWWGQKLCSKEEYIALWKYAVDQFKKHGVHNILYAYSSSGGFNKASEYLERYPGDDIIDLLGFDEYQNGIKGKENYINSVKNGLGIVMAVSRDHKKIPVLAETGLESIPDPKWWTETLWNAIKDYSIAYVLFWRNAHNKPEHFYVPFPGQVSAENFKEFKELPKTLFLSDIQ